MSIRKVLTKEELKQAKLLRRQGYTKRGLAKLFEVGETTIWENVFSRCKIRKYRKKSVPTLSYKKIKGVILVIQSLRSEGFTSVEVSQYMSIPLEEVNFIYSKYP